MTASNQKPHTITNVNVSLKIIKMNSNNTKNQLMNKYQKI